jgi:hypothetical protein
LVAGFQITCSALELKFLQQQYQAKLCVLPLRSSNAKRIIVGIDSWVRKHTFCY